MLKNKVRRLGVAALAVAAAAAIAVGGASAANAASGTSNQGMRDINITPDAPAVNFSTDLTPGTLNWNMGDGTPDSAVDWSVDVGDQATYTFSLPEGLTYQNVMENCESNIGGFTFVCDVSVDRRVVTLTLTSLVTGPIDRQFNGATGVVFNVVSHGTPITGNPTATFTPFPGLTTQTPTATGRVVQEFPNDTPLLAGGAIAALGLAGAGAVFGLRRHKKAA